MLVKATDFDPLDHVTAKEDLDALDLLAERTALRQSRRSPFRSRVALEVGSWAGSSALLLGRHFEYVFCVDTFEGTSSDRLGAIADAYGKEHVFRTFCKNMGDRLHRSVFPCVGKSESWAKVWRRPLDLIFIDADHSYFACSEDIRQWLPLVAPGGVICGHDYGSFPGVTRAVDQHFPQRGRTGLSVWFQEVPCATSRSN